MTDRDWPDGIDYAKWASVARPAPREAFADHLDILEETEDPMTDRAIAGYRIRWQHPAGGWFTGELWPDRATAEHVAQTLRESGWCLNVTIRPWSE